MFEYGILEAVRNNAFKAFAAVFGSVLIALSLTACSPWNSLKTAIDGGALPPMPTPEVATYVLDLSGSTNPMAQLNALGSGIKDFMAGQSLGNPFAQSPVAPRGLSIQFITQNSAQAPRIVLVSLATSQELYSFIVDKNLNVEGAQPLWNKLEYARTQIWQNSDLLSNQSECVKQVVGMLGQQQLLPDALAIPSATICQDAKQTANALVQLKKFIANPGIEMGSDVAGAVTTSLDNLQAARSEFPSAHLTLVIASDMVDEVSLSLPHRLIGSDSKSACSLANKDAGSLAIKMQGVQVVIVGQHNSKYSISMLNQVTSYWTCFFNSIGITHINQQSDLSGF
jgi:hypothetical protein